MSGEDHSSTITQFVLKQLEQMLIPNANRLDASNRRQRIIAAVLYESHFSPARRMNVREIAKRAGVSSATIYRYFSSDDQLLTAGQRLSVELYLMFLTRDAWHPNPVFRICTYLTRWVELWTLPVRQDQRSVVLMKRSARDPELLAATTLYFERLNEFWTAQLRLLQSEGYLRSEPRYELLEALCGPLESRILNPNTLADMPFVPENSWFEVCWRATSEFLTLHGTPYFHQMRRKKNWDADLFALQKENG
ncbi:TetR/AcrR family transcriptional regulator [Aquidulcibacter paucihalophilus]|uniref:TetR/AcrR family transcriptional regulator n=1 Tax=Aquidulcibacter paucihalophilus TaxID=1978549 RepID=UPI000A192BF1|nr:TetR/AcrR family transcriptional regulator [Aquidulcibacter paucihalophilus]